MSFRILFIPILFLLGLLVGCVTPPKPLPPSTYLLSTDKSVSVLLPELAELLKTNKYEIRKMDLNIGLLVTNPRGFVISGGDNKSIAQQILQLRQEGGSLKLRFSYRCQNGSEYAPCTEGNPELQGKIARVESAIMKLFTTKLKKSPDDRPESRDITQ